MIFNILWPIIEFFVFFGIRWLYRFTDKGMRKVCKKKQSVQDSVELEAGPTYAIHYKYSYIMNTIFITFMFGAGIPILFPIALAAFLVLYIMERLLLARSYRHPNFFD